MYSWLTDWKGLVYQEVNDKGRVKSIETHSHLYDFS